MTIISNPYQGGRFVGFYDDCPRIPTKSQAIRYRNFKRLEREGRLVDNGDGTLTIIDKIKHPKR